MKIKESNPINFLPPGAEKSPLLMASLPNSNAPLILKANLLSFCPDFIPDYLPKTFPKENTMSGRQRPQAVPSSSRVAHISMASRILPSQIHSAQWLTHVVRSVALWTVSLLAGTVVHVVCMCGIWFYAERWDNIWGVLAGMTPCLHLKSYICRAVNVRTAGHQYLLLR